MEQQEEALDRYEIEKEFNKIIIDAKKKLGSEAKSLGGNKKTAEKYQKLLNRLFKEGKKNNNYDLYKQKIIKAIETAIRVSVDEHLEPVNFNETHVVTFIADEKKKLKSNYLTENKGTVQKGQLDKLKKRFEIACALLEKGSDAYKNLEEAIKSMDQMVKNTNDDILKKGQVTADKSVIDTLNSLYASFTFTQSMKTIGDIAEYSVALILGLMLNEKNNFTEEELEKFLNDISNKAVVGTTGKSQHKLIQLPTEKGRIGDTIMTYEASAKQDKVDVKLNLNSGDETFSVKSYGNPFNQEKGISLFSGNLSTLFSSDYYNLYIQYAVGNLNKEQIDQAYYLSQKVAAVKALTGGIIGKIDKVEQRIEGARYLVIHQRYKNKFYVLPNSSLVKGIAAQKDENIEPKGIAYHGYTYSIQFEGGYPKRTEDEILGDSNFASAHISLLLNSLD